MLKLQHQYVLAEPQSTTTANVRYKKRVVFTLFSFDKLIPRAFSFPNLTYFIDTPDQYGEDNSSFKQLTILHTSIYYMRVYYPKQI